ncbi:MAG: hypothetical protein NT126_05905 [Bacteroidetes bacterium]|nr:hypothetical protein [Bacteroidota bacterium]
MSSLEKPLFEEKQYIGYNQLSTFRRLLLGMFCFAVYWWKIHNNMNGDLFFWLGMSIIFISIVLLFVLHIRISVFSKTLVLDGLWTTRRVKIDISDIAKVERKKYSHYHLNNAVFNLHLKGTVRFYTGGNEAVEITDREGHPYRIGTQRPMELERILNELIKK